SLRESRPLASGQGYGEIRTNSAAIAKMAAEHLLHAGFRSFAFCGFANLNWSAIRERAFTQFFNERGFSCFVHRITEANWMQRPNWIESWDYEQPIMVRWLKSLPKPVGLMTCNDACGREVLQACASAGLRVPDEVAVVGVDNDEMMCELSNPPLTSVALDLTKAGYEAAYLLDRLMSLEPVKDRVVWVGPSRITLRRSSDALVQEDPVIARALRFIRDHARENLGVPNVAEEAGVSRRTLERRFFRALSRSVHSEIMRSRLERAKELLLETGLTCQRIAVESGFGSVKTFNREFGRVEGTTPQGFRRKTRGTISGETSRVNPLRSSRDLPGPGLRQTFDGHRETSDSRTAS
ncbi:MAG TPA: substrate-binding domain-containing protein, partial [Terriglobia bacterium]|nr:substrate-binding domain-containing protein [Terriglobia bacterium]